MKSKEKLENLIEQKINKPLAVNTEDWNKINALYKKRLFYKWSWSKINIYYTVGLFTSILSLVTIIGIQQSSSSGATITNFKKSSSRAKNELSSTVLVSDEVKPLQLEVRESQKTNISSNTIDSKTINNVPLDSFTTQNNLERIDKSIQQPELKIEKNQIEIVKVTKLPVVIYKRDTIFDIDSTKVSKRKMRKINK